MTTKSYKVSLEEEFDSSDEELLNFTIVQFIKRGRQPKVRPVDVIPSAWLDWDKGSGRLKTRFMEDSDNNEDRMFTIDLIRNWEKTKIDPPESWPFWSVKILGKAGKVLSTVALILVYF